MIDTIIAQMNLAGDSEIVNTRIPGPFFRYRKWTVKFEKCVNHRMDPNESNARFRCMSTQSFGRILNASACMEKVFPIVDGRSSHNSLRIKIIRIHNQLNKYNKILVYTRD